MYRSILLAMALLAFPACSSTGGGSGDRCAQACWGIEDPASYARCYMLTCGTFATDSDVALEGAREITSEDAHAF